MGGERRGAWGERKAAVAVLLLGANAGFLCFVLQVCSEDS
jgi:hypothetical protein